MSRSHIAYGPKDAIGKVIAGRHIPTNCLVITKVADPAEEAELLYFDKDYTPHQISMRHVFPSMEVATEWVDRYYCVGRHIVVKDGDEWHSYIVGDDNELIVADGTDKVSIITAGDASVVVNGETMTPTISVNLDPEFANGLSVSEDGLMLNVATDSRAGAMSAADKFKLDEIEAGAQVNTITDIGTGSANGTISVNGVDVTVKGLGSAAFTDSDAYTPAGVGMSYMIVDELPADGAVGVIYLVPNEGAGDNVYDEFLYVNDEPELIGTTETDLSDYYTKNEVINVIRSEVDDAITGKVDTISLARVATTGSFNDLNDKPGIPIVLDVTKRSDGLYYPSITYAQGIAILESGGQLSIHWPENNLVYQCKQWRSTSSSIFFGTQDENTYRVLRWNSHTGTVEPFSNNTFATSANLSDKVDKVSGKGLSTNDFTNAEKSKLAGFGDASLYALKSEVNVDGKVDKEPGKGLSTNDFTNEEKNKLAGFGDANIYALKEDLNSIYRYKGSVATESALPNSGTNVAGDVYNVEENGMNYAWNGTSWDALGADPEEPVEVDPISNSSIDGIIGQNSSSTDPSDAMQTVETDRLLSHDGVPADAKATGDAIAAEASARQTQVSALQNAVGSPLVANTAAGMTSTDKIYVYTGSETGYTAGHWYYYNGSAWIDGGVYNSTALNTDTTLSVAGMAADAEATGDEISDLKSVVEDLDDYVGYNRPSIRELEITTQTYIGTNNSKLSFFANQGDKIVVNVSGTAFTGTTCTLYLYYGSSSNGTSVGNITIGEDSEFTLINDINGIGIYATNLEAGNIIISAKIGDIKGLTKDISDIQDDITSINSDISGLDNKIDAVSDNQSEIISIVKSYNLYKGICVSGYWTGTTMTASDSYGHTPPIALKAGDYLFPSTESVMGGNGKTVVVLDSEGEPTEKITGTSVGNKTQDGVYNSRSIIHFTLSSDSIVSINIGAVTGSTTASYNGNFMLVDGDSIDDFPDYQAYFAQYPVLKTTVPLTDEMIDQVNGLSGLIGKTAIFDGDSICKGTINGTTPVETNGWAGYIGVANSMNWHNYGVSGGVITSADNPSVSNKHSVVDNIDVMYAQYPDADFIIFEGGTNDADLIGNAISDPSILGSYTNMDFSGSYDDTTFTGALETLFYKATNYWKGKAIGFIVAHKMGYTASTSGFDKDHANRRAYFERAIEICDKWGIPYLNLWDGCYLNPNNPWCYDRNETKDWNISNNRLYTDGQHLTEKGYEYISPIIEAWMKTL